MSEREDMEMIQASSDPEAGYDNQGFSTGNAEDTEMIQASSDPEAGHDNEGSSTGNAEDTKMIQARSDPEAGYNNQGLSADDAVTVDVDGQAADNLEEAADRESMFFIYDGKKLRIDYVLVYKDDPHRDADREIREIYENNLRDYGLVVYRSPEPDIKNDRIHYVLLHAPWSALITGAELMAMPKRLKMPKSLEKKIVSKAGCRVNCENACRTSQQYIPEEGDFFSAPFHKRRMDLFQIEDEDTFFTNAERSLVVKEVLDRTTFTPEGAAVTLFGIQRLIRDGVYLSAYPLHEGKFNVPKPITEETFAGTDKDRALLYETWARMARFTCKQPLDLIRKYFGEKIGFYFAWLGFYTQMLIPATLMGLLVFVYGLVTMMKDPVSDDICGKMSETVMCPQCDVRCHFWKLKESCIYSRISYVFDNYATVVFSFFMSLWAIFFLEFWKRKQHELQYEWDVKSFEAVERMRPEFEFKVKRKKENPITREQEPYVTPLSRFLRGFTSLTIALFFVSLVIGAILGVIIYRMVIVTLLYGMKIQFISTWAKIISSLTASVINLIVILILGSIYKRIAYLLTELELHRTETEFEDAYSFKMFLFQFANNFGTTFYIAFFKGKFQAEPGSKRFYLFGKFQPDACDPSGCIVDLLIQLLIVMGGKQALNNFKEILIPKLQVCRRQQAAIKKEKESGTYRRWMQDKEMQELNRLTLFEEYIEMIIQYGFVTIFVAAFPLAPLFALINNIIEIRLDAYKLVTQYRRPNAMKAQDIGVWKNILETITYLSVISNSVIIAWTSDFVPRMVYLFTNSYALDDYVNSTLSFFDTNDYMNDTRPPSVSVEECRYRGYRHPPDAPSKYSPTEMFWIVLVARLAFILVFEHACFFIMFILAYLVPDKSANVRRLETYEKALSRHLAFEVTLEEKRKFRRPLEQFGY